MFLVGPKQLQVSDSLLVPQCHIMSLNFRASRRGFWQSIRLSDVTLNPSTCFQVSTTILIRNDSDWFSMYSHDCLHMMLSRVPQNPPTPAHLIIRTQPRPIWELLLNVQRRHRQWRFAKTKWLEGNGDGWITENKDYRASATKMMLITGDGAWEELRAPGSNWCEDTQHKSFGMLNNMQNLRHLNFRVCSASGWCIMTTECVMGKRRCRRRKSFLENRGIEERQDIWTPFTGKRQNQEGVKKGMLWPKAKTREARDISKEMGRDRETEWEKKKKNILIYIYRERERERNMGKHKITNLKEIDWGGTKYEDKNPGCVVVARFPEGLGDAWKKQKHSVWRCFCMYVL